MLRQILLLSIVSISSLMAQSLVFGVVPQQSPAKLFKTWQPFIKYLSKQSNINIRFQTAKSIPEFEKNLYNGKYDIAYSNPYHYTLAHTKANHIALARFDKNIVGILVSKKDSPINSLKDVKDKNFFFPAPKAFAATMLTKYDVLNKLDYHIQKSKKSRYVNSHDSVYLGVQRNIADVGGGIMRTFHKFKGKKDLKIIHTTEAYPSHPISISMNANISKETRDKIQSVLLQMPKKYTQAISAKPLIKVSKGEYESIKKIISQLKAE